eukprot:c54446_g1_i1 orf=541-807(-)
MNFATCKAAFSFSFGLCLRFLGRYPQTARGYYKPPSSSSHHDGDDNCRRLSVSLDEKHSHVEDAIQLRWAWWVAIRLSKVNDALFLPE